MTRRPLAIFDVDGTLVDSRATINAAISHGFRSIGREPPSYDAARKVVGLSFRDSLFELAPDLTEAEIQRVAEGYRELFWSRHDAPGFVETLYEGAEVLLRRLRTQGWKISMATGKSRRGVESVLRMHGWADLFDSTHCPDEHPGKPDPGMVLEAMRVLDAAAAETVMIGDTNHDMRMARAAGVRAQGVAWGFQTAAEVAEAGADHVAETWAELDEQLDRFAAKLRAGC
ncbi:MAG TPA: HAD-IA family hydrolase [Caulobacteraceae bacterium]|nr:HAD-IA family hydrolase [Caulobacteraceae bacterium]